MPQNVVDADTWTATVQCRADGEAVDGAGQLLMAQDLADRTNYLNNRTIEAIGGDLLVPMTPVHFGADDEWSFEDFIGGGAVRRILVNNIVATSGEAVIPLPALHNCTFDNVKLYCHGAALQAPRGGALPTNMPRVTLYHIDTTTGTETSVGSQIDTSANMAAYEIAHIITLTVAAQTIDSTSAFYASLRGESAGTAGTDYFAAFGMTIHIVAA